MYSLSLVLLFKGLNFLDYGVHGGRGFFELFLGRGKIAGKLFTLKLESLELFVFRFDGCVLGFHRSFQLIHLFLKSISCLLI